MGILELKFESGETSLTVRRFSVHEAVSTPYTISVWARSESPTIDIGSIVGKPAGLSSIAGYTKVTGGGSRVWSGICNYMEQTHAERRDNKVQSTYYLRIVPHLWLLDQRRDYRIFQHMSIPDIIDKLFDEWGIKRTWKIDRGQYPKHEFKVEYGESDFNFVSRLLEEAGIAYTFPDGDEKSLLLSDALQSGAARGGPPVLYEHNATEAAEREFVSEVSVVHEVRPGALTMRDYDFRKPSYKLVGEAPKDALEAKFEQYHYIPGGFFVEGGSGGGTPIADDKGHARHDQPTGHKRAAKALESRRADRAGVSFRSNLNDLSPGTIFSIANHPHPELKRKILVTDVLLEGTAEAEWEVYAQGVFADSPFRPPIQTPRPEAIGVQTVKVVGPTNGDKLEQEIHTDEFGRVRVQFPWDRHGTNDDNSSCWIRVNEGWSGTGFGWHNIPRVGHEVLVTFLEGDPDRPVVSGRLYNATHPVPYKLPAHKTISTWKSDSSPTGNGFNEIKFEDLKGEELFQTQAEKNQRKLVKNDETLTVGNDRDQYVVAQLTEIIDGSRLEHVVEQRNDMIGSELHTHVKGNVLQLVRGDEVEVNNSHRLLLGGKDQDIVVQGYKRERDEWDLNVRVLGDRRERVGRNHSMTVFQERHEKVGGTFARATGNETHLVAGKEAVGEAPDITVAGAGGFLRIDGLGVTISGTNVDINVSGSPGHGHGAHPTDPVEALTAKSQTGYIREIEDFQGHGITEALREQFILKGKARAPDLVRSVELVKLALSADVSTPHNGTVLWSGGDIASAAADQFVEARTLAVTPSMRLEGTPGGKALVAAAKNDPYALADPAWRTISKRLAEQASGEVNMVIWLDPKYGSVLKSTAIAREEAKVLAANKKVTAVNVFCVKADAAGNPVKDAQGKYVLEKIDMKDALKKPAKKAA